MNINGATYPASSYSLSTLAKSGTASGARTVGGGQGKSTPAGQLSAEEKAQVAKLKARDTEVRQHEQAHLAASGGMATSGATFTYQRGPDGVSYAVGGEVSIDTSPGNSPEETLRRAQTIRAAALAPAHPSGQDHAVAAQAEHMAQQAQMEIAQQRSTGQSDATSSPEDKRRNTIERYYAGASDTPSRQSGLISAYA